MTQPLLCFDAVSKRFGGTQAVDAVSFDVSGGEIVALLGENGAGKSTLIKLLAGVYKADSGSMLIEGQPESVWRRLPPDRQPMAFIHQDLGLVEWMTVAENVAIGTGYPRRMGLIDWKAARENARRVLSRVGCNIDPERRIFSLTRAEKSILAIGRALNMKAKLLVLDEPSASLPMADVQRMFGVLRGLREAGMGMIYVSHRLDEIMEISDRAVVMRDGRLVGIRTMASTQQDEIVELIVGKALGAMPDHTPPAAAAQSAPVLELHDAASGNAGPVSFAVRNGEIVGLVGLRGAGHESISRALFGREPLSAGRMALQGQDCRLNSPADAIRAGVAYVAAERLEENLADSMTVQDNLFPNPQLLGAGALSISWRSQEQKITQEMIKRFNINPPAATAQARNLSGGNQQKVVLARWMCLNKPLVVLEEPTAGVDVGAKHIIYDILRDSASKGTALLVVSTDFEEIASICTRVLVFRNGLILTELTGIDISMGRLLALAASEAEPALA
jgi:ribose transport system ATP-binding protein